MPEESPVALRLVTIPDGRARAPLVFDEQDMLVLSGRNSLHANAVRKSTLSPLWTTSAWSDSHGFKSSRPCFLYKGAVGISGLGECVSRQDGGYYLGSTALFGVENGEYLTELRSGPLDFDLVQIGNSLLGVECNQYYPELWQPPYFRFARLAVPSLDLVWAHPWTNESELTDRFACDGARVLAFDEKRKSAVCLDFETGTKLWETPMGSPGRWIDIWNGLALLGCWHLLAFDLYTGALLWRVSEAPSDEVSFWSRHEGIAYRVCSRHFQSVDLAIGSTILCRDLGPDLDRLGIDLSGRLWGGDKLAFRGDVVYFPCPPHFLALHRLTGEILWHGHINLAGYTSNRWIDDRLFIWTDQTMSVWEPGEQGSTRDLTKAERALIRPPRPKKKPEESDW